MQPSVSTKEPNTQLLTYEIQLTHCIGPTLRHCPTQGTDLDKEVALQSLFKINNAYVLIVHTILIKKQERLTQRSSSDIHTHIPQTTSFPQQPQRPIHNLKCHSNHKCRVPRVCNSSSDQRTSATPASKKWVSRVPSRKNSRSMIMKGPVRFMKR